LRRRIRAAAAVLTRDIPEFPGAHLESKGLALAVHYRGLSPSRRTALHRWVKGVAARAALAILPGKQVWDLVPTGHRGKARALGVIRDHLKPGVRGRPLLTVYAGDDATDAEAFRALPPRGLGIQVGGTRGPADFRLRNVPEVHALLRWIAERVASSSASSMRSSARYSRS
jgi:trehalose 6-phosphate phosphatase